MTEPNNASRGTLKGWVAILVIGYITVSYGGQARLYLESFSHRQECIDSALDAGDGEVLGLCGRVAIDDLTPSGDISFYVYDTSDQLLLPVEKRTSGYIKAAMLWDDRLLAAQGAQRGAGPIIPTPVFYNIVSLGSHFYYAHE